MYQFYFMFHLIHKTGQINAVIPKVYPITK